MDDHKQHPYWHQPELEQPYPVISVNNTLTGQIDQLIPQHTKQLKWYICGPTVYNSAHLGHARAYVTFDIIRRVLEDYFGYDIFFVMNITDIDDKIILAARRNYLFEQYLNEEQPSKDNLVQLGTNAMEARASKLGAKIEELQQLSLNVEKRYYDDIQDQIKNQSVKMQNNENDMDLLSLLANNPDSSIHEVVKVVKDPISEMLDVEKGHEVTDPSIYRKHAAYFEEEFLEDMRMLGVRNADVLTRVTEYVDHIIQYVQQIIDNGFGYELEGSVYFDTAAFDNNEDHDYAKLVPWAKGNVSLVNEGEGDLSKEVLAKKSPNDFALWKSSKPGEPSWESPWGWGRPGWHIECSAMASDMLGERMDIHSGGIDLAFPHHDNEIAQAEAHFNSQQWVNYFLHAGHLHIKGCKMSKSLKNFITIRQALENYTPSQLRMLFLLKGWDGPINFSDQSLEEAIGKEKKLKEFFLEVEAHLRKGIEGPQIWDAEDRSFHELLVQTQGEVCEALCNNFDFPTAIRSILNLVSKGFQYMGSVELKTPLLEKVARYVNKMLGVFGLADVDSFHMSKAASGADDSSTLGPLLDTLVSFRKQIRALGIAEKDQRLLDLCDQLRDELLPPLGIRLDDVKEDTMWKLVDPYELMQEIKEENDAAKEKKNKKIQNKINRLEKDLNSARQGLVPPMNFFDDQKDLYSQFDEDGVPSHLADGTTLSKKKLKGLKKKLAKHEALYKKTQSKLEENPDYVTDLEQQIEELRESLAL